MTENINDSSTQEQCPSKNCRRPKFDPPKADCKDPSFHFTLDGKEWKLKDDGDYHQVDSETTRKEAFDGLLVEEPETSGKLRQPSETYRVELHDGEVVLVRKDDLTIIGKYSVIEGMGQ